MKFPKCTLLRAQINPGLSGPLVHFHNLPDALPSRCAWLRQFTHRLIVQCMALVEVRVVGGSCYSRRVSGGSNTAGHNLFPALNSRSAGAHIPPDCRCQNAYFVLSKPTSMNSPLKPAAVLSIVLMVSTTTFSLEAQDRGQGPWWPHKIWGGADQAGGSNWITPEKIMKAVSLVRSGKVIELGHLYERGMPLVGNRTYSIFIPAFPTHAPSGEDSVVYNDEFVASEIGQVGTQFDGPGHVGRVMTMADGSTTEVFYNGFTAEEMESPYGLRALGIENVKAIITRGILIDIAAYKGVETLPGGYRVTLDDVLKTLSHQGLSESDIEPGDALLFNLGWWHHWPGQKSLSSAPYASRELLQWIIDRKACMIGSDASFDGPGSYTHTDLVLSNGIFNLEFMTFEHLGKEKVYTFLFIFTPLRLKGATGSPGRPVAVY